MDKVQEAQEWLAAIKADVTRAKDSLATVAADGESVSDILRHDKGHDDWHASHGDPPCKSEEDCSAMSAKYKDEEATKGGPGSGPHGSGGGASDVATSHRTQAAEHSRQSDNLTQAARSLSAAGYDKQATALHQEIGAHKIAADAHEAVARLSDHVEQSGGYPGAKNQLAEAESHAEDMTNVAYKVPPAFG